MKKFILLVLTVMLSAGVVMADKKCCKNSAKCTKTACAKKGAKKALQHCLKNKIKVAILKESSPSCGSSHVYDGSFSSTKIKGVGVTTYLLRQNGIAVYNEHQIDDAVKYHSNLFGLK